MPASALRKRIDSTINLLNTKQLNEVYGMIENYITEKELKNDWELLPAEIKEKISKGIQQLDQKKGLSHSVVMKKFRADYGSK